MDVSFISCEFMRSSSWRFVKNREEAREAKPVWLILFMGKQRDVKLPRNGELAMYIKLSFGIPKFLNDNEVN